MTLTDIVNDLRKIAESNEDRAFKILGARPGPGIDLLVRPAAIPMNGTWNVEGRTPAGLAFVSKFWRWQPLNNQKIAEARKQAAEWQLAIETEYPIERIE